MPNRGPVELSLQDIDGLLAEVPERDLKEAEDAEERQRFKNQNAVRTRLQAQHDTLKASGGAADATGTVVFSIDEVDLLLDCTPPQMAVRARLSQLQVSLGDS